MLPFPISLDPTLLYFLPIGHSACGRCDHVILEQWQNYFRVHFSHSQFTAFNNHQVVLTDVCLYTYLLFSISVRFQFHKPVQYDYKDALFPQSQLLHRPYFYENFVFYFISQIYSVMFCTKRHDVLLVRYLWLYVMNKSYDISR